MPRSRLDSNIRCPSCQGQLFPRVLVCDSCGLKVEGDFSQNEFGSLAPDELHFLRVFIHCEGRIRDMEAALGVSYPTVKASLAAIKAKLNLSEPRGAASEQQGRADGGSQAAPEDGSGHDAAAGSGQGPLSAGDVLDRLGEGAIEYGEAVRLLRAKKKGKAHGKQG